MIIEDLFTWALKHLNYTVAQTFSDEVISARMHMYSSAFLKTSEKLCMIATTTKLLVKILQLDPG